MPGHLCANPGAVVRLALDESDQPPLVDGEVRLSHVHVVEWGLRHAHPGGAGEVEVAAMDVPAQRLAAPVAPDEVGGSTPLDHEVEPPRLDVRQTCGQILGELDLDPVTYAGRSESMAAAHEGFRTSVSERRR
jgi:hypothetical protein